MHEEPFDRLLKYMDNWAGMHEEEVILQTGFSDYEPKNCKWKKMFSVEEMEELRKKARITITHGGPSSFMPVVQSGRVPIVVPRKHELGEHVNDHQVIFCTTYEKEYGGIIVVDDVNEINGIIHDYEQINKEKSKSIKSHNKQFCEDFAKVVDIVFDEKYKLK